jgi:hypothetical protein
METKVHVSKTSRRTLSRTISLDKYLGSYSDNGSSFHNVEMQVLIVHIPTLQFAHGKNLVSFTLIFIWDEYVSAKFMWVYKIRHMHVI